MDLLDTTDLRTALSSSATLTLLHNALRAVAQSLEPGEEGVNPQEVVSSVQQAHGVLCTYKELLRAAQTNAHLVHKVAEIARQEAEAKKDECTEEQCDDGTCGACDELPTPDQP